MHHNANEHPNVSQTLALNRPEDRYTKPVSNTNVYAFYGCDGSKEGDNLVQDQAMEASKAAFFADIEGDCRQEKPNNQDAATAAGIFWGEDQKELGQ